MTIKKKLLIALCVVVSIVAIVITTVAGTVAYLTSSAAVSNVFTIGNVHMTMYETKVNSNGSVTIDGVEYDYAEYATLVAGTPSKKLAKDADTNSYHLVPGETYIKDPTIYVQPASESSYLFIIARNDISTIEDYDALTMKEQLFVNGWMKYGTAGTGNIYVYTNIAQDLSATVKYKLPVINDADAPAEFTTGTFSAAVEAIKTETTRLFGVIDGDNTTYPTVGDKLAAKKSVAVKRAAALENLYKDSGILAMGVSTASNETKAIDLFGTFALAPNADITTFGGAKVEVTAFAIQTADMGDIGTKAALDKAWEAIIATYSYVFG